MSNTIERASAAEQERRGLLLQALLSSPIPEEELLSNLGLYVTRQTLSRWLFMVELYQKIIDRHGVIMEFGCRWGQNMALWGNCRGIYEPYNYSRKIVGFDTFEGFPDVSPLDGDHVKVGDYATAPGYDAELRRLLDFHEQQSPISHICKYEVIKGDVRQTLPVYLRQNPATIVALAYFDLDVLEPTRKCLEKVLPYLAQGSILAFDELGYDKLPGETIAARMWLDFDRRQIHRSPLSPLQSWVEL